MSIMAFVQKKKEEALEKRITTGTGYWSPASVSSVDEAEDPKSKQTTTDDNNKISVKPNAATTTTVLPDKNNKPANKSKQTAKNENSKISVKPTESISILGVVPSSEENPIKAVETLTKTNTITSTESSVEDKKSNNKNSVKTPTAATVVTVSTPPPEVVATNKNNRSNKKIRETSQQSSSSKRSDEEIEVLSKNSNNKSSSDVFDNLLEQEAKPEPPEVVIKTGSNNSKKIKNKAAQKSSNTAANISVKEDHPNNITIKSKQTTTDNNSKISVKPTSTSAVTEDEFENMGYISGDDGYSDKAIQPPAPIITQAASEEELEPIPPPPEVRIRPEVVLDNDHSNTNISIPAQVENKNAEIIEGERAEMTTTKSSDEVNTSIASAEQCHESMEKSNMTAVVETEVKVSIFQIIIKEVIYYSSFLFIRESYDGYFFFSTNFSISRNFVFSIFSARCLWIMKSNHNNNQIHTKFLVLLNNILILTIVLMT